MEANSDFILLVVKLFQEKNFTELDIQIALTDITKYVNFYKDNIEILTNVLKILEKIADRQYLIKSIEQNRENIEQIKKSITNMELSNQELFKDAIKLQYDKIYELELQIKKSEIILKPIVPILYLDGMKPLQLPKWDITYTCRENAQSSIYEFMINSETMKVKFVSNLDYCKICYYGYRCANRETCNHIHATHDMFIVNVAHRMFRNIRGNTIYLDAHKFRKITVLEHAYIDKIQNIWKELRDMNPEVTQIDRLLI